MGAYIYNVAPFDATNSCEFTFNYSGGSQACYNKLTIMDEETSSVVFEDIIQSFQFKHVLPENSLTNGKKYLAQIFIYDVDNKLCASTQPMHFSCYSTPIFSFANISSNQIVKTPSYTVNITYSQAEDEKLQSYAVALYSANKIVLTTSGIKYDTSNLSYTINDLSDNTQYYIRATGTTVNGMNVDTGYIVFSVGYVAPSKWCLIDLKNKPDIGAIQIRSNIVTLQGRCTVDPTPFVDGDFVDTTGDAQVIFDEGFTLYNDWTIIASLYGCEDREYIMILSDGVNEIKVQYRIDDFDGVGEVAYMELTNKNAIGTYTIYSNYIQVPSNRDVIVFCVRRKGNLFDIKVKKI